MIKTIELNNILIYLNLKYDKKFLANVRKHLIEYSTKLKSYPNFIYIKAQVVERIHIIEKKNNNIFLIYRKFNREKICALINEFKNAKDR